MDARSTIRNYVGHILARKGDTSLFTDEDSLLLSGRIDSLNVLEIVVFLSKEYHYEISEDAFDPILFDSVDGIVSMIGAVESK